MFGGIRPLGYHTYGVRVPAVIVSPFARPAFLTPPQLPAPSLAWGSW